MKTEILCTLVILCQSFFAQAQLYAPEIKVHDTDNNQVEVGSSQSSTDLNVFGNIEANQLYLGQYSGAIAGAVDPYIIRTGTDQGNKELIFYGPSSGSNLDLRLQDGE